MLKIYFNKALIWDFIIAALLIAISLVLEPRFTKFICTDNEQLMSNVVTSLVTVGATLIGFLLTIITIIVTFKKGYSESANGQQDPPLEPDYTQVPKTTIFDRVISKEQQFYGTPIHSAVTKVFVHAAIEIGLLLIFLILLQFQLFKFSCYLSTMMVLVIFFLLILCMTRSIFIFKQFLSVHLNDK